ncbi:fungal-specific transcription factor domain-containing protein [Phyllosticta paracitricarpa]|uniref:Fungal-specific transcription factor domain-containing protein n=1 Tax=Phyllosticta paracitricarpa TaxID=2016321 RepID=A0ABR1NFD6_9PEZI
MRKYTPLKAARGESGKARDESSKERKRKCTPTACAPCRKRKSKCDGAIPSCSSCTAVYKTECHYGGDSKLSTKGTPDAEDAGYSKTSSESTSQLAASVKALPGAQAARLIEQIQGCKDIDALAKSTQTLRFGAVEHQGEPSAEILPSPRTGVRIHYGKTSILSLRDLGAAHGTKTAQDSHSAAALEAPLEGKVNWTFAPTDLVHHLLGLYFSRIHPYHPVGAKQVFWKAFEEGDLKNCSPLLVNAILAFSCHYSDRLDVRTDPEDARTAGDQFFAEARRLLNEERSSSISTIKALAIMSLREISMGRDSSGFRYIRQSMTMIIEMGLHLSVSSEQSLSQDQTEIDERSYVFWGCYALDVAWALCTGRTPSIPNFAMTIEKEGLKSGNEDPSWEQYIQSPRRPVAPVSQTPEILYHLTGFYEITSGMLSIIFARGEQLTSETVLHCYAKFQSWYHRLPTKLQAEYLVSAETLLNLPSILLLNMIYHNCIFLLFRLATDLSFVDFDIRPWEMCRKSACNITQLMRIFRQTCSVKCCPPLVIHILFWSSVQHLEDTPDPQATQGLLEGIQDLEAMAETHPFAAQCVKIIREYPRDVEKPTADPAMQALGSVRMQTLRHKSFPGEVTGQGMVSSDARHHTVPKPGNTALVADASQASLYANQPGASSAFEPFQPDSYYHTFTPPISQTEMQWTPTSWPASDPGMVHASNEPQIPGRDGSLGGFQRPHIWQNHPGTGQSPSTSGRAARYPKQSIAVAPFSRATNDVMSSPATVPTEMNLMALEPNANTPSYPAPQNQWANHGPLDAWGQKIQKVHQSQYPAHFAGSAAATSPTSVGLQGQGQMDYGTIVHREWLPRGPG